MEQQANNDWERRMLGITETLELVAGMQITAEKEHAQTRLELAETRKNLDSLSVRVESLAIRVDALVHVAELQHERINALEDRAQ